MSDTTSDIRIKIGKDKNHNVKKITWNATDSTAEMDNDAKAMLLSFWDPKEETALRIDLWTQKMMMDEMAKFITQTLIGMSDTYYRATGYKDQAIKMQRFAEEFLEEFQKRQKPASEEGLNFNLE